MSRIAILDQKDAFELTMPLPELLQGVDIMLSGFDRKDDGFHQTGVDDQKHQDVHGAVAFILKFLLLNRTGNRPAKRATFQDLTVGYLIDTDRPETFFNQMVSVAVAPQDLLCATFELRIEAAGFPIASSMRLQVDFVQNPSDRARTDGRDDTIGNRLAGQIMTRPMGNVQSFSHRFQASQSYYLCPLQGGKSAPVVPGVARAPTAPIALFLGRANRSGEPSAANTASGMPRSALADPVQ